MGFLDKLFNRDTHEDHLMGDIVPEYDEIAENIFRQTIKCGIYKDKSKEIKAEHWDGLSDEARKALSDQGFYREGDDESDDEIVIR